MKEIDMFLKGYLVAYNYEKYNDTLYGLAKIQYNKRFVLVYSGDITSINGYNEKLSFEGLFDIEEEKLYVSNEYYNILYSESDFEKESLNAVLNQINTELVNTYNKCIFDEKLMLKANAYEKFKTFYNDSDNMKSLLYKAEELYKSATPFDYELKFDIDRRIDYSDLINYLQDKETTLYSWSMEKLNSDKIMTIYSDYSGGLNVQATEREKIGFMLLKQEKIKELLKEIEIDKNPKSKQLKKLRSIKEFTNEYTEIKNVIIGFSYKGKSLEVQSPMDQLSRLSISDWYLPVKDRQPFNELFADMEWSGDERKILSIKYIKYRGKVIYEDENV